MQKQEFLELFEAATRAAKSTEVSRCIDAMNRLKKAPASLACDLLHTTLIGKSIRVFTEHKNPKIRSESKLLWDLWRTYLQATGTKQSRDNKDQNPTKEKQVDFTTGDSKRDKVREILRTSLSKVANEVIDVEMKKRVGSCDPSIVAVSVESAMFERLGCFMGPEKLKYRSILFNMGDSNNPDLRRKVLIGEIDGERLVTMKKEEMGSEKIQMEVQQFKEKSRSKEDNRIKMMMMMTQSSNHMIMT